MELPKRASTPEEADALVRALAVFIRKHVDKGMEIEWLAGLVESRVDGKTHLASNGTFTVLIKVAGGAKHTRSPELARQLLEAKAKARSEVDP